MAEPNTHKRLDKAKLSIVACVLAVITFLGVNIFANSTFRGLDIDLTEERLFTLSEGTRQVLQEIDEPIIVRLFVTKRLAEQHPGHANYADRIRELLERYVDISDGLVQLELYNPEAFTDEEDLATAYGLQGVPLDNTGELGYYGLAATNSIDDLETIPYLSPERESFLEYDLTKLIYKLARDEKPLVGLIAGLPVAGGPQAQGGQSWAFVDQVREFFDVTTIAVSASYIPDDVDTLLIVHPKNINEQLMYEIDQFVLRGGRVVAFVDANSEIDVAMNRGAEGAGRSDFDDMLNAWGVNLVADKVLGDLSTARRVNVNLRGQTAVADYVVWLALLPDNFSNTSAITADLQQITLASAGILEPVDGTNMAIETLLQSSPQSMEIDTNSVRMSPDVVGLFSNFDPSGDRKAIAVRTSGRPETIYPGGRPPLPDGGVPLDASIAERPHLTEAVEEANIIVVSDVDMLHEQFWMDGRQLFGQTFSVPFANNADFAVNAIENLSGGTALMSLRARSEAFRPFTYVEDVRQAAEREFRDKETQLNEQLETIQTQLAELLNREQVGGELVIGPEDKARAEEYRRQMIQLRRDLRDVQFELRKDIDTLDATLKFFNIAAIPLLLGGIAIVWFFVGRTRRARRYRAGTA